MKILIEKKKDFPRAVFEVSVDGDTATTHEVSLEEDYYKRLTGSEITPENLVKKSFEFLLMREPNTSILKEFNLKLINRYFPDYEDKIKTG